MDAFISPSCAASIAPSAVKKPTLLTPASVSADIALAPKVHRTAAHGSTAAGRVAGGVLCHQDTTRSAPEPLSGPQCLAPENVGR
jgi:hypothetical protein